MSDEQPYTGNEFSSTLHRSNAEASSTVLRISLDKGCISDVFINLSGWLKSLVVYLVKTYLLKGLSYLGQL